MSKVRRPCLIGLLATAALCMLSGAAVGQYVQQPVPYPANVPHAAADQPGYPTTYRAVQPVVHQQTWADAHNASQPSPDWESWKAEVDSQLQAIADKDAAANKKAAGSPSVKVGGRVFVDWYGYQQNANSFAQIGDQQNGFRFEAVRIFVSGDAFHVMDYKIQMDFAGTQSAVTGVDATRSTFGGALPAPGAVDSVTATSGSLQAPTFKDAFITVKELPLLGRVRVGHQKEPFSMDHICSSRYINFMERSLADAFAPARNVGIMAFDQTESQNMTWAVGAFISEIGDEPPIFQNDNGGTAATMRYTYLPWYDEATEGRGLLHFGVAYSYRDIADGTVAFASRPEADLGSAVVGTGTITDVPYYQLLGLEAALAYGAFHVQSEYIMAFVQRDGSADPQFNGAYVQVSYCLTGEHRPYNRSSGTFSNRIKPFENFFRVRDEDGYIQMGIGAWEVAYRCSYLDLNDAGVAGGNVTDHTAGVNWYLNPHSRLMFNYVNSDLRRFGVAGNMNIFETRFQIDF